MKIQIKRSIIKIEASSEQIEAWKGIIEACSDQIEVWKGIIKTRTDIPNIWKNTGLNFIRYFQRPNLILHH